MTSTLSVILMEIVQKAMEAQNLSTTPPRTASTDSPLFSTTASVETKLIIRSDNDSSTEPTAAECLQTRDLTRMSDHAFSDCHNKSDNDTALNGLAQKATSYWALALLLIPTFTLFGNLLVILSVVKYRSLHSPINYFILGLAIADMCVAMAVMPFAVYVEFNENWELGTLLCDLYCAADVTCSTASIFLLTVISFDRYVAATQPIRYANSAKGIGRVAVINLAVWIVSMLIASPMVLGLNNVPDRDESKCMFYNADFIIYSSTGSFCIPLVIIIYLYSRIYCVIRERSRFAQQRRHILGAASRFSVAGGVEKSVVICASNKNTVAEPIMAAPATSSTDKEIESPLEKERLLDMVTTLDGVADVARENNARRRSKSFDPLASRRLTTTLKGSRASITANSNNCAVSEKRKSRFGRSSTDKSSSVVPISDRRRSSPFGAHIIRINSTSSVSSGSSSSTTKGDGDVEYRPHIDLIRHLQKTSHALASRHRGIPDGKRKSFLFTGACNSFFRNVTGVASSDAAGQAGATVTKRSSWHPSTASNSSATGRSGSQARSSESSSTHPESPEYLIFAYPSMYARSKSISANDSGTINHINVFKPSLSATTSLDPNMTSDAARQPIGMLRPIPQLRLCPPPTLTKLTNQRWPRQSGSMCVGQNADGLCFVNEFARSDQTLISSDHDDRTGSSVVSSTASILICSSAPPRNYETFKPFALSETAIATQSKAVPRRNTVAPYAVDDGPQSDLRIIENLSVTTIGIETGNSDSAEDTTPKMNGAIVGGPKNSINDAAPDRPSTRPSVDQSNRAAPKTRHLLHPSADLEGAKWYRRLSTRLSVWRRRHEFVNGTCPVSNVVISANQSATAVVASKVQPMGAPPSMVQPRAPKQPKAMKKVSKSQRKEKKATKTLAIVLGIFLICWLPFFTLNLLNAVCIKLEYSSCQVGFLPFFLTTWLGYMNSLMNPIIYTIFNMDFRRAFKQILCPCFVKHRTRRV